MRYSLTRSIDLVVFAALAGAMLSVRVIAEERSDAKQTAKPVESQTGDAHLLRYRFEPNQFVRYEVAHKMTISTQKGEASETAVNESKTRKHFRVASVDGEGNAVLEPEIDHVHMAARFGEEDPVVYDSESGEPAPKQFRQVQDSIGKTLARIKVKPNGELISATPLHQTVGKGRNASADNADAEKIDPNLNFLVVFPERPVRIGETWKDRLTTEVTISGKLKKEVALGRRYTLTSVEDGVATIDLKTSVLTPIHDPGIRGQLIQRTPSGKIAFDLEKGLIVSRELTLDKVEIGVAGPNSSMRAVSRRTERLLLPDEVARTTAEKRDGGDAPQKQ